jgi:hypothetical protein
MCRLLAQKVLMMMLPNMCRKQQAWIHPDVMAVAVESLIQPFKAVAMQAH